MAKSLYYTNQIIYECKIDEHRFRKTNEFYEFMELHDRKLIKSGKRPDDDMI